MNENLEHEYQSWEYRIEDQKLITISQFTILNFVTFGLYALWWMYKEWRFFKEKDSLKIQPALRAILSIIFIYSLFKRILDYARSFGYSKQYNAVFLLLMYIFFTITSLISFLSSLFSMVWIFLMIPPFQASNYGKVQDSRFKSEYQSSFSTKQIILIILGIVCWYIVITGLIFGDLNQLELY
ncbi:hypothetical protein MUB18_17155 [Sphingobacterium sp. PCS056]|uniref:hypothetical protein n=1 Tax=Sphingobacterium sp. PCS056 TaxID=2931400 RepID=UPI00200D4274|nr:hypothetical protein [Sphingobacterium sp. PCS056]UPZ35833.1 hypothetical protein MUB18_17155 [Sphingobacterium sp. PCS056]